MGNITGAGLRKAVMKALNPKAPGLEAWLTGHAHALVDQFVTSGVPADLRRDFTVPYSTGLHCHILGIPQSDGPDLYRSLHVAFMNSPRTIPAAGINWDRDMGHMIDRLNDPETTGLMAELAALRSDPDYAHLTDEMLATVGVTMFGAGVISVMGFLTMALVSLIQHPDLKARLIAEPALIPAAVDELLRINLSIADGLPRIATETMQLGDVTVQKGSWSSSSSRPPTTTPPNSRTRTPCASTGRTRTHTCRSAAAVTTAPPPPSASATHRSPSRCSWSDCPASTSPCRSSNSCGAPAS